MVIRYAETHAVVFIVFADINIKDEVVIRRTYVHGAYIEKFAYLFPAVVINERNDFEDSFIIACGNAGSGSGSDALHSARVGYDNALDILDNITADEDIHLCGDMPENTPCSCGCEGNRYRFGTAGGRNKLGFQNIYVGLITAIGL